MPSGSRHNAAYLSHASLNVLNPRSIQVISLDNPRAFLYKAFMTDEECNFLMVSHQTCSVMAVLTLPIYKGRCSANHLSMFDIISGYNLQEHSKPNMYKSGVVDAENGGSSFSDIRTSTGSFVPKGG